MELMGQGLVDHKGHFEWPIVTPVILTSTCLDYALHLFYLLIDLLAFTYLLCLTLHGRVFQTHRTLWQHSV